MGLAIHEALILFGLDRETGAWHSTRLDMGVASAVLSDLILLGAVDCDEAGLLRALPGRHLESEVLTRCLAQLAAAGSISLDDWVRSMAESDLTEAVAQELCRRKILRERKVRFLLVFAHSFYEELDGGPEREMRQRIETALAHPTESPDPFVHMLLSVADATGLLPQILDVEILLNQEPQADELPPQDSPADTSTDQFTDQLFHTTLRMEDERALAALERTKMNLYGGLA